MINFTISSNLTESILTVTTLINNVTRIVKKMQKIVQMINLSCKLILCRYYCGL